MERIAKGIRENTRRFRRVTARTNSVLVISCLYLAPVYMPHMHPYGVPGEENVRPQNSWLG